LGRTLEPDDVFAAVTMAVVAASLVASVLLAIEMIRQAPGGEEE
jgi:hypothetical protein